jgi:putative toxin-antitoxin system antitoxin component (TIGR02293 family)
LDAHQITLRERRRTERLYPSTPILHKIDAIWHNKGPFMHPTTLANKAASGLSAASVLGGEPVLHALPRSVLEWIALVRHGISAGSVDAVVRVMGIGQSELSRALDIPERTLARRKKEGVLSADESGKMVRLAQVIERAVEVFEDEQAALSWLKNPNAALGGSSPLSLLDTELGSLAVSNTLGRIEHGVFA